MIRLLDGPAAGAILTLRRAPVYLRVVIGPDREVDALDQLNDKPKADEAVHAYRRQGDAGTLHVDYRDKQGRRRGDWYVAAEYRLCEAQPADDVMRSTDTWRAWCLAEHAKTTNAKG